MGDVILVCKICYGSSSHKPNPTLTPESKAGYEGGVRKCGVCRQGWASIRVARETGAAGGRWVRLRQRPKISTNTEYQMCKNVQSGRGDCPRGQDCSYAHYRVELAVWNAERKLEPRPAPPITGPYYVYQLCKHIQSVGRCPYGQRCTFAHSEEEYREWIRSASPMNTQPPPVPAALPAGITTAGVSFFKCEMCSLACTSRKQLEDHYSGGKHRDRLVQLHSTELPSGPLQKPLIRRRPLLSFQITGFKMCMHVQASRRCVYGDFCTFAHSNEELQAWNRALATPTQQQPLPSGPSSHITQGECVSQVVCVVCVLSCMVFRGERS